MSRLLRFAALLAALLFAALAQAAPSFTGPSLPIVQLAAPASGSSVARIQAALGACAGGKCAVQLGPGSYTIDGAGLTVPSGTRLLGPPTSPGATLVAATSGNAPVLGADAWNPALGAGAVTTCSGNVTVGSPSLTLAAAGGITNGAQIFIYSAAQGVSEFTVLSGGGTTSLTLDHQIRRAYLSGDNVYASPGKIHDIEIGNITISGTGSKAGEFIGGVTDLYAHDLSISGVWSAWVWNGDYACTRCRFVRIHGPANNSSSWFVGLEDAVDSSIESCDGYGPASVGYFLDGCINTHVVNSSYHGGTNGFQIAGEGAANVTSTQWSSVRGGDYSDNTSGGGAVQDGSSHILISGVTALRTGVGLTLGASATTTPPSNVTIDGCDFSSSTTAGILIGGGNNHVVRNTDVSGSGIGVKAGNVSAMDGLVLDGMTIKGCTGAGGGVYLNQYATNTIVRGCTFAGNVNAAIVETAGVGSLTVDGCHFTDDAATIAGGSAFAPRGTTRIANSDFVYTGATYNQNTYVVNPLGAADVTLSMVTFTLPNNTAGFGIVGVLAQGTGITRLSNVRGIAGGGTCGGSCTGTIYGWYSSTGANKLFEGANVDFSAFANPFSVNSPSVANCAHGVVANGASDVAVTLIALPTTDATMGAVLTTAGGTPFPLFQSSAISGSSVNVRSTAGNTGTYTVCWR